LFVLQTTSGAGSLSGLPALTAEILKELSVWLEQHSCVFSGKALLIGLDRSVESEEITITIEGGGENGIALGIAVAANLFGLGVRLSDKDGNFAISARADLLSALVSKGAPEGDDGLQVLSEDSDRRFCRGIIS
jgi:hypothetical protein